MAAAPPPASPELGASHRELLASVPARMARLREQLGRRIVGQDQTVHQLLLGFLAGGHVLVIGVPGLAKTLMIRSLSELFDLDFSRIQFTPDLMPSDITGTTLIDRDELSGQREFRFRGGPIFTHLLLADEINRTPPKTQAALLEAMEEHQVTVGGVAHTMPNPFFVLATQNPIEQEGTYPLPVTQLDRFLFQIDVDYPDVNTEFEVVATTTAATDAVLDPIFTREEILQLLSVPKLVKVSDKIVERATRLVRATRTDEEGASQIAKEWLSWGAGPRAIQAILVAARSAAVLEGRDHVIDADYEQVVLPALRHRILLNYHAEAEFVRPDQVLQKIREEIGDTPARPSGDSQEGLGRFGRFLQKLGDPSPAFRKRR